MPRDLPRSRMARARLIGADTVVPCLDGRSRRYVNLDYAASTPVLAAVWEAVEAFLPWYSSVHRGSGLKSQVSTAAFEEAREDGRRVRRRSCRGRSRLRPQHDRGDQRPVGRVARGHAGALEPGRASLEHASLAAPPSPAAPVHRIAGRVARRMQASASLGAAADRPGRRHRGLERHRRGVAGRRAGRARPRPRGGALRRRSATRRPPPDRHDRHGHRLPGALRPQALCPVRNGRAGGRPWPAPRRRAAAARRRSDRARDAGRRHLGRRAPAPRGRLAERRRSRRARRGLPHPARRSGWRPSPHTNGRLPRTCGGP